MSRLNDLIRQLRLKDPALADDLQREVEALAHRHAFGLNFERHVPEAVELPGRRVRRGDKVRVLPPRGTVGAADEKLWRVAAIDRTVTPPVATLDAVQVTPGEDAGSRTAALPDLVVVAEFRDPIPRPRLYWPDRTRRRHSVPHSSQRRELSRPADAAVHPPRADRPDLHRPAVQHWHS